MLLNAERSLIFLGVETRTSQKTGNNYQMVILADDQNYERFEFFKMDELVINGIKIDDRVFPTIELVKRGFNINTNLVGLTLDK